MQKLQRLQDACDKTGTAFIVLITPNKASIETEYIPETWLRRYDPRPTAYDQFVPLLKKHGVRFVDGHALTLEAKANAAAPVFPKGGIHWGSPVAFHTTHALLRALQAQGKPLQPLEHEALSLSDIPQGDDADLMRLMNLVVPWRYPVASLQVKPRKPLSGDLGFYVTFVGGSFTTAVAEQLSASGQFSEVNSFFYYKQDKRSFGGGALKAMKSPVDQVDLATEVFASDFLVLEINESFLDFSDRRYAITFVDDALRYLKKSEKLVKFPFLREGEQYLECQLGHEISFRSDNHPFGKTRDCLTGFAECDVSATWTDGPTATLRLSILPPDRDLLLEVKAGALFHPPQLPEQVIEVYANNQFIGKWKIAVAGETGQQATIPKNFVSDGGKLTLRFEIENPMSPASLGMGDDPRKLGIWFSSMRLSEAMAAED